MPATLIDRAKSIFHPSRLPLTVPTPHRLEPGLYHFTREVDGFPSRFHLRVDPDGAGLLIANASAVCRLSPSGVIMAQSLLADEPVELLFAKMLRQFAGTSRGQLKEDFEELQRFAHSLAEPGDNYPITNLDDSWATPHARQLSAPMRADVPVHADAVDAGIQVLHKLWEAAIPQVCLLVSSDTPPAAVIRLVERAEDIGMIAGVRILKGQLMQGGLLNSLAQAGVDYIVIPCAFPAAVHNSLFGQGDHEQAESAFGAIHEAEVCPVAQIPLLKSTAFSLGAAFAALTSHHVTNVSFFAIATPPGAPTHSDALIADALPQVASLVEESSHEFNVRFLWEPPVERDPSKTIAEQCLAGPRCAGDAAIRIEPDGSVIPPRGPYRVAGNLLQQEWSTIWDHEAFRIYRERVATPTRCDTCPGLAICAADCPKDPRGWATA